MTRRTVTRADDCGGRGPVQDPLSREALVRLLSDLLLFAALARQARPNRRRSGLTTDMPG